MVDKNTKWEKQAQAAKATQVAFDVSELVHEYIQKRSVDFNLKPSDFIRKLLGLEFKIKKVRPRLTVTLSHKDYLNIDLHTQTLHSCLHHKGHYLILAQRL